MKYIVIISFLLAWGMSIMAQEAGIERFQTPRAYEELESTFVQEDLNRGQKSAFSDRADQKLADFFETLSLVLNDEYEDEYREFFVSEALTYFQEGSRIVSLPDPQDPDQLIQQSISEHLRQYRSFSGQGLSFRVLQDAQESTWELADSHYSQSAPLTLEVLDASDKVLATHLLKAEWKLSQGEKTFGAESDYIWEVWLAAIHP